MEKIRIFKVKEEKGDLPYTVSWISQDGRLSCSSHGSYKQAMKHFENLSSMGRQPSISLNLTNKQTEEIKE